MNKKNVGFIILISIAIYFSIGFFPISRFETDSMAISNSCEHMINEGIVKENIIGHSFHMQSGTYFLIISISKFLHVNTFTCYSILTIIASLLAFYLLVLNLHFITNEDLWKIAIILLLFQEVTAIGYYPNSAVIATVFFLLAFYLILKFPDRPKILIVSAPLLAISAWMRIDVTFAFPSLLFLLYFTNKNFWKATYQSTIIGICAVFLTLFLMWLMNARIGGFMNYTDGHLDFNKNVINMGLLDFQFIRAHISFFSILLAVLILIGIIYSVLYKEWKLFFLWFSGVFFYYLFGINYCSAPKHLSYFLIFWALMAILGIKHISKISINWKVPTYSLFIVLFIIQYIIGYKLDISSIPYANKQYSILNPTPIFLKIANIQPPSKKITSAQIVLGIGTKIPSVDEVSASSGIIFSPVMWHNQKAILKKAFDSLTVYINETSGDTLNFLVTDGSSQFLNNALLSNDFDWKPEKYRSDNRSSYFEFVKANKTVLVHRYMGFRKSDTSSFSEIFKLMNSKEFVALFLWDWQVYMMEEYHLYNRKISNGVYEILQ